MDYTSISLSAASFDVLADYNPYSDQNISAIHFLQLHAYLSDELGLEILSTGYLSRWLLSVDVSAYMYDNDKKTSLRDISVELNNASVILDSAFKEQDIGKVNMPSVKEIQDSAFSEAYIYDAEDGAFRSLERIGYFYSFAYGHMSHKTLTELMKNVKKIGFGVFQCADFTDVCDSKFELTAPELTSIDHLGFQGCYFDIDTFYMPKLSAIGDSVFNQTYFIKHFKMPELVLIGKNVFMDAYNIEIQDFNQQFTKLTSFHATTFKFINTSSWDEQQYKQSDIDIVLPKARDIYGTHDEVFEYYSKHHSNKYLISYKLPNCILYEGSFCYDLKLKRLDFTGNNPVSTAYNDYKIRHSWNVSPVTEIIIDNLPCFFCISSYEMEDIYGDNSNKLICGLEPVNSLTGQIAIEFGEDRRNLTITYKNATAYKTLSGDSVAVKDFCEVTTTSKCNAKTLHTDAFSLCDKLTRVNLASVVNVHRYAFWNSNSLSMIALPNAEEILNDAFLGCKNLLLLFLFKFTGDEISANISKWLDLSELQNDLSVYGCDANNSEPSYIFKHS